MVQGKTLLHVPAWDARAVRETENGAPVRKKGPPGERIDNTICWVYLSRAHKILGVSMRCPYCGHLESRVLDSRTARDGRAIRRRRVCEHCGRRFTTYEEAEDLHLKVRKRDGRVEPFRRDKLLRSLEVATNKRPVGVEELERVVEEIEGELYDRGERVVSSEQIGELVMERLKVLDPVAYVRFASVYLSFDSVEDFRHFIEDALVRQKGGV